MTSPEGTDEAVEAAARAMLANGYGDYYEHANHGNGESLPDMEAARDVVAAAAPFIAAKALRDAVHAAPPYVGDHGGYLLDEDWLLARADEIERAARAAGKDKTDER